MSSNLGNSLAWTRWDTIRRQPVLSIVGPERVSYLQLLSRRRKAKERIFGEYSILLQRFTISWALIFSQPSRSLPSSGLQRRLWFSFALKKYSVICGRRNLQRSR